jgi:hypothetical protein
VAKLTITTNQAGVISALVTYIEDAFREGVEDGAATAVTAALQQYTQVPSGERFKVRDPFRSVLAALLKAANIPRALPNTVSGTVTLAKLTGGGANGSLTFVDGLITAFVAPT